MTNDNFKYVLWVGGCDDYYNNLERALEHLQDWLNKGYDQLCLIDLTSDKIIFKK